MAYHMNPHQEEDLVHCNGIPTMETTMFASMKGKLDESQRPSQCVREGTNAVRGPGGGLRQNGRDARGQEGQGRGEAQVAAGRQPGIKQE